MSHDTLYHLTHCLEDNMMSDVSLTVVGGDNGGGSDPITMVESSVSGDVACY